MIFQHPFPLCSRLHLAKVAVKLTWQGAFLSNEIAKNPIERCSGKREEA